MFRQKRLLAVVIGLTLYALFFAGCTNKGTIASVVYNHVASLRSGTVKSSTDLWADEAKKTGRRMAEIYARFNIPYPIGAKIVAIQIEKSTAQVTAEWQYSHNLRPETYCYTLKKVKGKWRIADCLLAAGPESEVLPVGGDPP